MNIAGWAKSSLIDFPKHASTVFFVGGCNFRCGYCHNPEIVFAKEQIVDTEEIFAFLQRRKRFLDGVCITGGEPTVEKGLRNFIETVKEMGYKVKLDTNGSRPGVLKMLITDRLLDYIAMDIKGPLPRYDEITGVKTDTRAVEESIDLLLAGDVDTEFRTTVCQEQIGSEDIKFICQRIKGAKRYFIQNYRKTGTNSRLMASGGIREGKAPEHAQEVGQGLYFSPHTAESLATFQEIARQYVKEAGVR